MTKIELMRHIAAGLARECFEHQIGASSRIFDVSSMRRKAIEEKWPIQRVPVAAVASFLRSNRVWEQSRVDDLTEAQWKDDPAMAVLIQEADGTVSHLFIDGTHRVLRAEQEGAETFLCYVCTEHDIIEPAPGWGIDPNRDWGDTLKDGKILKSVAKEAQS